jgi:hypothetical protein
MSIMHMPKADKPLVMEEAEIHNALAQMEQDHTLATKQFYTKNSLYPVRGLSFFDKHATYLKDHPKVNAQAYLSNLRTMIKIRP